MSLLDLIRRKARPIRSALDNPQRRAIRWFGGGGVPTISHSEYMNAEAAMVHPIIFRCVNKIGLAVQDIGWYVETDPEYKGAKGGLEKYRQVIQAVLDSPNDQLMPSQLRYWLTLNKAIYNRFGFKVGTTYDNKPNAVYPLSAQWLKTVYKDNGLFDKYVYEPDSGNKQNLPSRRQVDPGFDGTLARAFAYLYVTPNLSCIEDYNRGNSSTSPLNSVAVPAKVISMLLQRAADTASGHPNTKYIISGEKTLGIEQEDAVKEEMEDRRAGEEESGNILFLANTSIKIDKLDNGMADIHSKIPLDDMTRMIYAAYGVPLALAGINSADASKFAGNFESSRRSFYEDTIIPNYCGPIAQALTYALCPPGLRIMFDYDTIPGLGEIRSNKAKTLQGVTFLSTDEKRELCGFPKKTGDLGSPGDANTIVDSSVIHAPKPTATTPSEPAPEKTNE